MKSIEKYKFPDIRQISTRDIMYNVTNASNTAVHYI